MKKQKYSIILLVAVACVIMAFVDAVIRPDYAMKSAIKVSSFLILPFIYSLINRGFNIKKLLIPNKKGFKIALILGLSVYALITLGYLILKNIIDFSPIVGSLSGNMGVDGGNFVWVALYISFINSLLEEFFFRGFAFLSLKEVSSKKLAYVYSAMAFALYHVAMMLGWFSFGLLALTILGLFVGGLIFNLCNEKSGNIYVSWLIHMFANFGINTVGFMLFGLI